MYTCTLPFRLAHLPREHTPARRVLCSVLVDHKRVLFVNICNILGRMREYEAWHTIVEVAKEC